LDNILSFASYKSQYFDNTCKKRVDSFWH